MFFGAFNIIITDMKICPVSKSPKTHSYIHNFTKDFFFDMFTKSAVFLTDVAAV